MQRDACEALVDSAFQALQAMTHRVLEQRFPISRRARHLPTNDLTAMCRWIDQLSLEYQRELKQLLAAWDRYGCNLKQHLEANIGWLNRAAWNTEVWLNPPEKLVAMPGGVYSLEPAHDPLEVFQMGQRFNTCLSFGGCNDFAVLANAWDANKLVVYVRNPAGRCVGRKLLAIAGANQLLGYESYFSEDSANCDAVVNALDTYAARLAAQCGLVLAEDGEPDQLGPFEWYNDGCLEWSRLARNAFDQARAIPTRRRVPQRRRAALTIHPGPLLV